MEKKGSFADQITALLVTQGALAKKEVPAIHRNFAQTGHEQFDDFLLEEGLVEPEALLKALSELYQVPSFDVTDYFFDTQLLRMFPKDFLLRNGIIPYQQDENMLVVIASEPEAVGLERAIREFVSYDIDFYVGIKRNICDAVKEFYDKAPTQEEQDQDLRQERLEKASEQQTEDEEAVTPEEDQSSLLE
jgi:hypothetical protein